MGKLGPLARMEQHRVDEDCLGLNVWTPSQRGTGLPVMVWLHPGAFSIGSGSHPVASGDHVARSGNVVVVSLNSRLGALGFLAAEPDDDHAPLGNAGLLDVICAMTWIRDNVGFFGGDPDNITIFGASGGALRVGALLMAPSAQGLFHRAIVQSGPLVGFDNPESAIARGRALFDTLGIEGVKQARELPVGAIVEAQHRLTSVAGGRPAVSGDLGFAPVIDGSLLPMDFDDSHAFAGSAEVPVLIGTTRDEFTRLLPSLEPLELSTVAERMAMRVGVAAHAIVGAYRERYSSLQPVALFARMLTDHVFRLPTLSMADRLRSAGHGTWTYRLDLATPVLDGRLGAPHTLCIPLIFGTTDVDPLTEGWADAPRLSSIMSAAWTHFARAGQPALGDSPLPSVPASTHVFDLPMWEDRETDLWIRNVWSAVT